MRRPIEYNLITPTKFSTRSLPLDGAASGAFFFSSLPYSPKKRALIPYDKIGYQCSPEQPTAKLRAISGTSTTDQTDDYIDGGVGPSGQNSAQL